MTHASEIQPGRRWPLIGALFAALGASACCILPLLGAVLGLSTLGIASSLGAMRPLFLVGAALMLFVGARRVLGARKASADACGCEKDKPSVLPSALLLLAIGVGVLALSFGPELLAGGAR